MKNNPYRYEIVGVFVLGPFVMGIEVWRRWGDFLNPGFYDDYFYFLLAMFAARSLYRRRYIGQLLWLYACGIGTFCIYFSLFGSLYDYDCGDVSGIPMPGVLAFKIVGVILISIVSYRAFALLRKKPTFSN